MDTDRRTFLLAGAAALGATHGASEADAPRYTLCAFSKHFQWTDVREMSTICAGLGYEGIDLTVRAGGHVLPERAADDLPKAAETIRQAGLKFTMITGEIVDTGTPHAETVLRTLASLGVRYYRWGGFRYDLNKPIPPQLAEMKVRVKDLAAMNKQYGVCAMYHTHSGAALVGASIWDLYILFGDLDPNYVSANYDVGHATVEGGLGGWIHSAHLMLPYMRGVALKDFAWAKDNRGVWNPAWCALGQGMVNFKQFLPLVKSSGFAGPLQLHFEYPELGGASTGGTQLTIPKEQFLAIMRRDIGVLRGMLKDAGMA